MIVQIDDWELDVNVEATKQLYASFPRLTGNELKQNFEDACITSVENPDLKAFFDQLGIDIAKPLNLHALPIEGECVMYTGSYHFIGSRIQGELDEWDVAINDFYFALTEVDYDEPNNLPALSIEISFEAVLPWLQLEPIPVV